MSGSFASCLPVVSTWLVAASWLVMAPSRAYAMTLRSQMLCEARRRLDEMALDVASLDAPRHKAGVTLQLTRQVFECGGNQVPMAFGSFTVENVSSMDVLAALASSENQTQWDPLVSEVVPLGDFVPEKARGITRTYPASVFSDRQLYEWQVVNRSVTGDELWVVWTTRNTDELLRMHPLNAGAVHFQDCMAAYRVRTIPTGAQVHFTTQVNAHPFLVSQSFVFSLTWGKTVDYIAALRQRAKALARMGSAGMVPAWMFDVGSAPLQNSVQPARELSASSLIPTAVPPPTVTAMPPVLAVPLTTAPISLPTARGNGWRHSAGYSGPDAGISTESVGWRHPLGYHESAPVLGQPLSGFPSQNYSVAPQLNGTPTPQPQGNTSIQPPFTTCGVGLSVTGYAEVEQMSFSSRPESLNVALPCLLGCVAVLGVASARRLYNSPPPDMDEYGFDDAEAFLE